MLLHFPDRRAGVIVSAPGAIINDSGIVDDGGVVNNSDIPGGVYIITIDSAAGDIIARNKGPVIIRNGTKVGVDAHTRAKRSPAIIIATASP